jgi:Spy/CpxP family protein refolding chaperone
MSTRLLRIAALSATMLLTPTAARLVLAADEPPKTDVKDPKPAADAPERRPGAAPGGPEGRRGDPAAMLERVESALNDLKLSEEQKTKARELLDKVHKSADENKGENARQGMMKSMQELREGLDGLLTEDQKKQLAEKAPFLSGGGPGGPGAGRPGGARPGAPGAGPATRPGGPGAPGGPGGGAAGGARPAVMQKAMAAAIEKAGLSDEQKAKIKTLSDEYEKKTRAILEEGKGDRAAIGEKLRPLMDERRAKIAEILSPEQMTKYQQAIQEEIQKARGEGGGPGGAPGGQNRRPNANRPGGAGAPDAPKPADAPKTEEKKSQEEKK